jgi:hypothetical protein
MSTSHTPPTDVRSPPSEESVRRGHEVRDVNPRVILWLGAGVLIMAAVVHVVLWLALGGMRWSAEQSDPPRSPLAAEAAEPPPPHLQDKPQQEYTEYRREQDERLASYGWIDREQGIVRIPISRAIDLIVEQGVPKPQMEAEEKEEKDEP